MTTNLTDVEIAWLAGLLEGEGTFAFDGRTQKINLQMTDEDVVIKYCKLLEKDLGKFPTIGAVSRPNRSEIYQVSLTGSSARHIMQLIIPHMCSRRRARIWQSLNRHIPPKLDLRIIMARLKV